MTPNTRRLTRRAAVLIAVAFMTMPFASAQTYTIKAKASSGGTIEPSGLVVVAAGADQTFTITPNTGYSITSVVANKIPLGPVTSYTFVDVQRKGSIKAKFKIQQFAVTFSASDGVIISPSGTKTMKYGSNTKVTVTPPSGSAVTPILTVDGAPVGLTPAGKGFAYVLIVSGPHVVHASLAPSFNLNVTKDGTGTGKVTSDPAGIDCGATCSRPFNQGAVVTLSADADNGSTFTGWSGACAGTGSCQVTLDADTAVSATFTLNAPGQHTLTVAKNGTGTGSVSSDPAGISCGGTCGAQFDEGSQITLTAHPASALTSSTFAGWSGGGCSGTGTCTVILNSDTTVTATFNASGGGGLTVHVVDSCDAAAVGAIVAVHNPNGSVQQTFTVGASGTVDLSSFGATVTFTIGWPNSMNVPNAEIHSFVDVPSNLGTFNVAVEGGTCPPNDPLLGNVTVNINPDTTAFATVDPLGIWLPVMKVLDVHDSDLQTDGKLSLLANDYAGLPEEPVNYGFLLDQTFTNGATYEVNLDKSPSNISFSAADNIQYVFIAGTRKGVGYTLGQTSLTTPALTGEVAVYDQFPVTTSEVSASAPFLFDGLGFPYSSSTWTQIRPSVPAAVTVPSLLHVTDFTYDSNAVMASWTLSDNAAGTLGMIGFANTKDVPVVDDRFWTIVLDPTTHSSWAESNLVLPPELDLTGRTPHAPSIIAYTFSYIHTHSDALKSFYAGGVTPPTPPYDLTFTLRTIP